MMAEARRAKPRLPETLLVSLNLMAVYCLLRVRTSYLQISVFVPIVAEARRSIASYKLFVWLCDTQLLSLDTGFSEKL